MLIMSKSTCDIIKLIIRWGYVECLISRLKDGREEEDLMDDRREFQRAVVDGMKEELDCMHFMGKWNWNV